MWDSSSAKLLELIWLGFLQIVACKEMPHTVHVSWHRTREVSNLPKFDLLVLVYGRPHSFFRFKYLNRSTIDGMYYNSVSVVAWTLAYQTFPKLSPISMWDDWGSARWTFWGNLHLWHPDFNTCNQLSNILRVLVDPITFPLGMKKMKHLIARVIKLVEVTSLMGNKYVMAIQINKLEK